ncbi:MAG: SAM-dependent chlorinase/fluorinase [Arenicellales bacterium]|nr:SAM-dependent chlorinase/fluorinase [Arenicellales bacterium]|tara:strand:+ start:3167 stop:3901 length:735 start_codon:yes stop_codon:yes gene_type:complete
MIALLTDYGQRGPYVGMLHSVLSQLAPEEPIVDLIHDLPRFNIRASAYLIPPLLRQFEKGTVFLCVVDPGVGSDRGDIVIEADGFWFVGPDNGLFNLILKMSETTRKFKIGYRPEYCSESFHGRDLFAPVAAALAKGDFSYLARVDQSTQSDLEGWPDNLAEIIYIDQFGNCFTGIHGETLGDEAIVKIADHAIRFARVFSDVKEGELFWYRNSVGLVEIAANRADCRALLAVDVGQRIVVDVE